MSDIFVEAPNSKEVEDRNQPADLLGLKNRNQPGWGGVETKSQFPTLVVEFNSAIRDAWNVSYISKETGFNHPGGLFGRAKRTPKRTSCVLRSNTRASRRYVTQLQLLRNMIRSALGRFDQSGNTEDLMDLGRSLSVTRPDTVGDREFNFLARSIRCAKRKVTLSRGPKDLRK